METHFFLVTTSTCATYLWSNMAVPVPVIISAFQIIGQENNTSIWKWHITSTQIPLAEVFSMVMANLGVQTQLHSWAGECDPTTEYSWWVTKVTTLHSCPCNSFFFGSPHIALSLFWPADMDMDEVIREKWPRLYKYEENKKGKKIRKYKNAKSIGKYAYNHNFAVIQFRYTCHWWINL